MPPLWHPRVDATRIGRPVVEDRDVALTPGEGGGDPREGAAAVEPEPQEERKGATQVVVDTGGQLPDGMQREEPLQGKRGS